MNFVGVIGLFKARLALNLAFNIYLGITAIALVYHVLILAQLESLEQMRTFEVISIITQVVLAVIIGLKVQAQPSTRRYTLTKWLVFLIAVLFLLNTLGNLFAIELFERLVFTPLTLIASLMAFRIALE